MRKWVLFSALVLFLFYFKNAFAGDVLPVMIINQIRGSESCCQSGTTDFIISLESDEALKKLDIAYALRYDALTDEKFIETFKNIDTARLGVLLEITPNLASASGVSYKGAPDGSDWYHARNAFLVGYTQDERKKLIDMLLGAYQEKFKTYPLFSVSWMVDAYSLKYLQSKYGVKIHELTKEQYETDNYTLSGGIFNVPYIGSSTHPLIPGKDGLIMLRQTVSDIDQNYGSSKAYFTSQPNDYLGDPKKKDFSYFASLLESARTQKEGNRFAVLGLENSKEWENYKQEFLHQLKFVSDEQIAGRVEVISPQKLATTASKYTSGRMLASPDFPRSGALWYFGDHYRVRMEIIDGKLQLSDYRIYPTLTDPYFDTPTRVSRAYWVLPYLLDSSQEFKGIGKNELYEGAPTRRDEGVQRLFLTLSKEAPTSVLLEGSAVKIRAGDKVITTLKPDILEISTTADISFTSPIEKNISQMLTENTEQFVSIDHHPRFVYRPNKEKQLIDFGWEGTNGPVILAQLQKKENIWELSPQSTVSQKENDTLASIFQPDRSGLTIDSKNTIVYWNNTEAISGRNSLRVYIDPRNSLNRPSTLSKISVSADNEDFKIATPAHPENFLEPFFIDITSEKAGSGSITISLNGEELPEKKQVTFYTDCTKDVMYCLKNIESLKHYASFMFHEQLKKHQKTIDAYKEKLMTSGQKKLEEVLPKLLNKTN